MGSEILITAKNLFTHILSPFLLSLRYLTVKKKHITRQEGVKYQCYSRKVFGQILFFLKHHKQKGCHFGEVFLIAAQQHHG
jgi:hypothetical protein